MEEEVDEVGVGGVALEVFYEGVADALGGEHDGAPLGEHAAVGVDDDAAALEDGGFLGVET